MIAGTLKGIVSQRLVKTADGHGRVACCEIMVMTGRVHDMILDPKLTGQLPEVVAEGGYYGMQTFDQHLLHHLQAGRITYEEAMRAATSPHDFKLMVAASGPIRRPLDGLPARAADRGGDPVAAAVGRPAGRVGAAARRGLLSSHAGRRRVRSAARPVLVEPVALARLAGDGVDRRGVIREGQHRGGDRVGVDVQRVDVDVADELVVLAQRA